MVFLSHLLGYILDRHGQKTSRSTGTGVRCLCILVFIVYQCAGDPGKLDLSHQPNLNLLMPTVVEPLGQIPLRATEIVDVSSSVVEDEGLQLLLSALVTRSGLATFYLNAQFSHLTSKGVTSLFSTMASLNSTTAIHSSGDDRSPLFRKMDLGWNQLVEGDTNNKALHGALHELIVSNECPEDICLECTGIGPPTCRTIAKGLIARCKRGANATTLTPISLRLACNEDIGDAGAAALAAAIRIACDMESDICLFDTLDLSNCNIGDAGAEALSLALEEATSNVPIVCRLILSNNRITDHGALSLGRTFYGVSDKLHLDLSNNKITDRGVATAAASIAKGTLASLSLRSCQLRADGAEAFGRALRSFATIEKSNDESTALQRVCIDMSGNPLGMLRGKTKKGSNYSASKLKSKASATASAYMNQGLSFFKKGLGPAFSSTAESDDEQEKNGQDSSMDSEEDPSKMRCGFKALAGQFVVADGEHPESNSGVVHPKRIHLGLRRTFCDTAGADALAAMLVSAKNNLRGGVDVELELDLNPVVEEDMISALHGDDDDLLSEMADRYSTAQSIIRQSLERAAHASRFAESRFEDDDGYEAGWEFPENPDSSESWNSGEESESDTY